MEDNNPSRATLTEKQKTLRYVLIGAGTFGAALTAGIMGAEHARNIDGDGIKPAGGLVSKLLGVERQYNCEYHPISNSGEHDPWVCDLFPDTFTRQPWETAEEGSTRIEDERWRYAVAKGFGPGAEFAVCAAAIVAGFRIGRKREGRLGQKEEA